MKERDRILQIVAQGPTTARDIADELRMPVETASAQLHNIANTRRIALIRTLALRGQARVNLWRITGAGLRYLESIPASKSAASESRSRLSVSETRAS